MNHQEFENYLTLLSSLLQLRGEQREAIAGELRAHLEDRLDELLARGIDRDEAVRLALEEFGDAAGLAANFSLLVRNRRRRWIVKMTSYTTAALVLLALGLMAIWPEHRPGPAPQRAVAQNPVQPIDLEAKDKPAIPPFPEAKSATKVTRSVVGGDNALEERLSRRLTVDFVDTPLSDVLGFLAETSEVQMFVNRRAFADEGLELDEQITISLRDVRLDLLLDLVLDQATSGGATYVERDGILIISTVAMLDGATEVRVYNCRDLLALEMPKTAGSAAAGAEGAGFGEMGMGAPGMMGGAPGGMAMPAGGMMGGGMGGGGMGDGMGGQGMPIGGGLPERPMTVEERRADTLSRLIMTAVKPDSWQDQGGYGTISSYNGLFVVNHNAKTHKQIENVLRMLREAAGIEQQKAAKTISKR
jgi:hypothetical protein